ncbi:MAG: type II toxin-antitoxin system VapC family toxin [Acidobacteria bacterium]|nr:type II toxin-antitoxin system VapC family toxin [Acidobacteriota bacterium]
MTGSEPVVIDSSGWLEYITGDAKAELFAPYFETDVRVLVPVIVLYEVRKVLLLRDTQTNAQIFESEALRRHVIDIDEHIALSAATMSLAYKLSMADAIIYATAQRHRAHLITSDSHFNAVPGATVL